MIEVLMLYGTIDHTVLNTLHVLLNCKIGALDCWVISSSKELLSVRYTYNTYSVIHWSMSLAVLQIVELLR